VYPRVERTSFVRNQLVAHSVQTIEWINLRLKVECTRSENQPKTELLKISPAWALTIDSSQPCDTKTRPNIKNPAS